MPVPSRRPGRTADRLGLEQRVDGPLDGFADRETGTPTRRLDTGRVEEDERVVAHPAAPATGVRPAWIDAESFADPCRRLVDRAVVGGAEVEDLEAARAPEPAEHGSDAVSDLQVALPLLAVAED